jgi:hypothetical protein
VARAEWRHPEGIAHRRAARAGSRDRADRPPERPRNGRDLRGSSRASKAGIPQPPMPFHTRPALAGRGGFDSTL